MLYIRKSAIYLMNRLLKWLINRELANVKCYYCSLWVMIWGGLVARKKRKHLMVV